jgi:alpha-beta hydrolase superfamily lysophospholipase
MEALNGFQQLSFKSMDDVALTGYWCPSHIPGATETVILAHGYFNNATSMYPLAKELTETGKNVFLFDFRGHGKSQRAKATLGFHEGNDILAALDTIKTRFPDSTQTIHYLGHSMGAAALMLTPESLQKNPEVLARLNDELNGKIILDSPFSRLNVQEHPFVTQFSGYTPKNKMLAWAWKPIQPTVSRIVQQLALGFEQRAQTELDLPFPLKDLETAKALTSNHALSHKPILLLHGTKDSVTAYTQAEEIDQVLQEAGSPAQFVSLDADHVGYDCQIEDTAYRTILRDKARKGSSDAVLDDEDRTG